MEMTRDIWGGHDYIPLVFDRWVADAGAAFQAAEIDGQVVGLHRLRPYAPGLIWYEGLRVATTHQRAGVARAMLASAVAEARELGFREMRLGSRDAIGAHLFESAGFRRLVDVRWWRAPRMEGGESARIPDPAEARKLWTWVAASAGIDLYNGVSPDFNGARDLGPDELARLAGLGMLRVGLAGRALVGLREPWRQNIAVAFVAGGGGALRELLLALRFEADADVLDHVTVNLPRDHPAEEDLRATGYDFVNAEDSSHIYGLEL